MTRMMPKQRGNIYEAVNLGLLSAALLYSQKLYSKYAAYKLDSLLLRKRTEFDFSVDVDHQRKHHHVLKRRVLAELGSTFDGRKESVDYKDI
jgi:hypothetical protein